MSFDLDPSYKGVAERIADFRAKHPEGCLRPVDPARPFWFETVADQTFVVYAAAAYRSPDDPTPGIGVAWEPFPGKTPYTAEDVIKRSAERQPDGYIGDEAEMCGECGAPPGRPHGTNCPRRSAA